MYALFIDDSDTDLDRIFKVGKILHFNLHSLLPDTSLTSQMPKIQLLNKETAGGICVHSFLQSDLTDTALMDKGHSDCNLLRNELITM